MRKLIGLGILSLTMVAFQNCGRVAFDTTESGLSKTGFAAGPELADVVIDNEDISTTDTLKGEEVIKTDEVAVVVEDKQDDVKEEVIAEEEVAVVEDKKDEGKKEEKQEEPAIEEEVVAVVEEKKDEGKKEEKQEEPATEEEVVAVVEEKKNEEKKDAKQEEKKQDNLTDEEVDLIACSSDVDGSSKKVLVCHYPKGNVGNRHAICISRNALKAHLGTHGKDDQRDTMGACPDEAIAAAE